MPKGFIPKYFDYIKALKVIVNDTLKNKAEDTSFQDKVHGKTRQMQHRGTGKRVVTYVREVQLPPGMEDEAI